MDADVDGTKMEIDLALLARRRDMGFSPAQLVLCECKSENPFEKVDIERMRLLAERFPQAVMVFATLRDRLSPHEVSWIRGLGRTCARIMILTSSELLTQKEPPSCWEGSHQHAAGLLAAEWTARDFDNACRITQALHLGGDVARVAAKERQRQRFFERLGGGPRGRQR